METLRPGDRVGHYEVGRSLGSTRTGALYEVVHLILPRRSLLKVADSAPLGLQLMREACIVAAIQHPGMPIVFDSGVLEDRRPWFAVEWNDGVSLAEHGEMDAVHVAALVRDVADILASAHRRGVFHLALRPYRIVLTPDGRFPVYIPDWSTARAHDAQSAMPALAESVYDAPELTRGEIVDDRADVFSLGVIAYMALTGVPPTREGGELVPLRTRCPRCPLALTRLIDQMVSPDPWERPSAAMIHAELLELVIDVVEAPTAAVPMRIRKPRWTPPLAFAAVEAPNDEIQIDVDEGWLG